MTRKIKSLKENECILISTKREARIIKHKTGILSSIRTIMTMPYFYFDAALIKNIGITPLDVVLPASDFIKPRLKDRVKALELQQLPVVDAVTVLSELPEKWCVYLKRKDAISYLNENIPAMMGIVLVDYRGNFYGNNMRLDDYTEITTAQFCKWVLKEQPKEIDWSVPGQLVVTKEGCLCITINDVDETLFYGFFIEEKLSTDILKGKKGEYYKSHFKIYNAKD